MPAKYGDIGKKANDLFDKNYELGKYKCEFVTKAGGIEHTTKGHLDNAKNTISSSMESKMKLCKLGELKMTFTPGKNDVACELANSHPALKGGKVTACFNASVTGCPITGSSFSKVKAAWSNDKVNINADSNFGDSVNFDASAALCDKFGLTFGLKSTFNYKNMSIPNKEIKLNVCQGSMDYTMTTKCNNDWNASIHNQINSKFSLATAIKMGSCGNSIAIAGKKAGCCGATNLFKLDNTGKLALSHVTPTSIGADLTMSAEFDACNLNSGSHKVGAGMKFTF